MRNMYRDMEEVPGESCMAHIQDEILAGYTFSESLAQKPTVQMARQLRQKLPWRSLGLPFKFWLRYHWSSPWFKTKIKVSRILFHLKWR